MATRADIYAAIKNADAAGDSDSVRKLGAYLQTMPADAPAPPNPSEGGGTLQVGPFDTGIQTSQGVDRFLAGAGAAMSHIGRAVGQLVGLSDQANVDDANKLEAPLMATSAGKAGNVAGTMIALAPTALIPGAASLEGAAAIGAGTGALTTEGGLKDRAIGAATGAAGGAVGKAIGNTLANGVSALATRAADKGAAEASKNAVRDATLVASRDAGYVLPPSETMQPGVKRTFTRVLEGLGGKAALGQEASVANRDATNLLARKAIGLPGEGGISQAELDAAKAPLFAVYDQAAKLSPEAEQAVQYWRQANFQKNAYQKFYERSADPKAQQAAQQAASEADQWFQFLTNEANKAGQPQVAADLVNARVGLGKIGTVESSLNDATGDVSARKLASLSNKGAPLNGPLETAAQFAKAYPRYAQDVATTAQPGVSALQGISSVGLGATAGPVAAALPFLAAPSRALLLSRALQSGANPTYGPGPLQRLGTDALVNALRNGGLPVGETAASVYQRN